MPKPEERIKLVSVEDYLRGKEGKEASGMEDCRRWMETLKSAGERGKPVVERRRDRLARA